MQGALARSVVGPSIGKALDANQEQDAIDPLGTSILRVSNNGRGVAGDLARAFDILGVGNGMPGGWSR
jgi:hypothetical protein